MRKIFSITALILSVGLSFAYLTTLQTTMAQVELPTTTNVTLLNATATDNTISNTTNDDTGMDESAKP